MGFAQEGPLLMNVRSGGWKIQLVWKVARPRKNRAEDQTEKCLFSISNFFSDWYPGSQQVELCFERDAENKGNQREPPFHALTTRLKRKT